LKSVSGIIAITPARNESTYLPMLAAAMEKQTLKPDLWMIVDDGSSDSTPDVAREFAVTHSWVQLRRREDRGRYFRGKGVAETLGFGVTESNKLNPDWKLLAKIDADTYLPESYFNQVSDKFSENPRLGIASGVNAGERGIPTHPRGNNRVYRTKQLRVLGGGKRWLSPTSRPSICGRRPPQSGTVTSKEKSADSWDIRGRSHLVAP
jgi:glycosyltransferase involved in cell wall biosynthesis